MSVFERLFRRERSERDLDKEIRLHIEQDIEASMLNGLARPEAERLAHLKFGGTEQVKELCRDERRARWLEDFVRDVGFGTRMLRKSPGFTAAAVLSLALGIGASVAIFGLMDRVMLRFMPVHEPERLVALYRLVPPYGRGSLSYPMFEHFRTGTRTMAGMFAQAGMGVQEIDCDGHPEEVNVELVSGSYYGVLGVQAVVGRTFTEEDDRDSAAQSVAVISNGYWKRRFGSDPHVIGRSFRLRDTVFTIIGVTPPEFYGALVGRLADITIPLVMDGKVRGDESWRDMPMRGWLQLMGRLRDGYTFEQAQAEMQTSMARYLDTWSAQADDEADRKHRLRQRVAVEAAGNGFDDLRRRFSDPLKVLMALVSLVLAIACVNIANLLLARSAARQREIAVRLAIGAGRGRVIRQLLTEGLVLAMLGGTLGVLLSYWLSVALVTMMSNGGRQLALDVRPDTRIAVFAALATLTSCLVFSLAPAIQSTRNTLQNALRQVSGFSRWRLGKSLVATQVAIALVLVAGAAIFGRTLLNFYRLDAGFTRDGIVLLSLNASKAKHDSARRQQLQMSVLEELQHAPHVTAAASVLVVPIGGGGWDGRVTIRDTDRASMAHLNEVSPGFFRTLGTPILAGREFDSRDRAVAVVNETFAKQNFGSRSPIGRYIWTGPEGGDYQIIGVVKDMKYQDLRRAFPPTVYFHNTPETANAMNWHTYLLRTDAHPTKIRPSLDDIISRIDPSLKIANLTSLTEHIGRSLLRERMMALLAGSFGIVALILASIGIYGVVAFQAQRRTKEVGIRIALGAAPRQVRQMLIREVSAVVVTGGVCGLAVALLLAGNAETFVYGFKADDPATFIAAALILAAVALIAAYLPGRRASRVNPVDTLRYE